MLYRLRHDFHLSIITLLGASAMFGITPFAIYRFYTGNLVAGVIDMAIMLSICVVVGYAWLTGDNRRSGFLLALFACGGAVIVATVVGDVGLFWLYPAMVTSFFLTSARVAVTVNCLAVAVLVFHNQAFASREQMMSLVATAIVVSCCAYIFSRRNEHQRDRLERLATHDPLTGVKNRRAMEEDMQTAVAAHARTGEPYALIIFDLDHFKRINDLYGHAVGDEVLVECASLIQRYTRKTDCLYRFGGEEFVVLMPGVRPEGVRAVAENLRYKLAHELTGPVDSITASFGVAPLHLSDDADRWMARADKGLYAAKASGRNCVVIRLAEAGT
ncbi:GGDEF domain-containing protein [Marinobacter fonticola]|uniref:GGDEF domain-containing protein n=1 Tax=Marinobacter fonticola TaxID=2603215 RepID=UPI0011E64BF2|nr:GGDEF domain-containing protein [Marinobacter fonticola]